MSTKLQNKQSFYTIYDDIFNHNYLDINNGYTKIVPHVCNNMDLFGSGFAGLLSQKYPIVKQNYHLLGKSFLAKNPGYTQSVIVEQNRQHGSKLIISNMIAQDGVISSSNKRPLNYVSLCKSMVGVKQYIKQNFDMDQKVEIHSPKFGSGLAGGNWNFISLLIEDIWGDIPVYVYEPKFRSS
jgi:hypothetical protein